MPTTSTMFSSSLVVAIVTIVSIANASSATSVPRILGVSLPFLRNRSSQDLDEPSASVALASDDVNVEDHTDRHRGKPLGVDWDAGDLYRAYKEIQTDYHEKLGGGGHDWRVLAEKNGVEVAMLEHPSDRSCPYVRMTATIPTSLEDCWEFLSLQNWESNMPKMDPFFEGLDRYGEFDYNGVNMILARKRTKRLLAFGKRDFCFVSVSDVPLEDGTWVSGTVSVRTPTIPRVKGYTRAFQDSIAFYRPLLDDGSPATDAKESTKTNMTIMCRIDLNDSTDEGTAGWMPMWLYVKTIGKTGAKSVNDMKKALIEQVSRG